MPASVARTNRAIMSGSVLIVSSRAMIAVE
jgi:hypothetical protein